MARAAREFGNTEALVDERDRLTFAQLQEAAFGAARALVASGIQPGGDPPRVPARGYGAISATYVEGFCWEYLSLAA